jgi:hypothetical protein
MAMEKPPMPPDLAAQTGGGGAPPFADVGAQMGQKQQAGNPLKGALDTTTKLWMNVVKGNPKMGPYVQRAMAILNAGIEESSPKPEGGGAPTPGDGGPVPPGPPPPGAMPG